MRRRGGTCVRHPASLLSSPLLSSSHSPSLSLTLHPSYLLSNRIRPLAGLFACASPKHLDATRVRRRVGYPSRHLHRRRTRVLCAPPPTHPPKTVLQAPSPSPPSHRQSRDFSHQQYPATGGCKSDSSRDSFSQVPAGTSGPARLPAGSK